MLIYFSTQAKRFGGLRSFMFGLVLSLVSIPGYAQTAGNGSIQGTVMDQTGAVTPNVSITLTNTATHVAHAGVTGRDGLYSFPNIAVGTYTVEASAPGFAHYRQSNIILEVGSSIAVNISLTLGGADQSVEVQSNALALQTEDTSFKQTIDEKTVTELPLNGRQVTSLLTLSGGAVSAPANDIQGSKNFYSSVVVSIAGGQGNSTDYRLDGGDHNDWMTNINLPFPFPDAVSQFSVETTALGAQSGLHPGGLVNVVTRSGSDQLHGTAFEFIRNNYLDATNFFSVSKDTLHQNQYGGTLGGRLIKDKLFFFGGYQRLQSRQSQASKTAYVPTAANLAGDFSASDGLACPNNKAFIQLLDPHSGAVLPNDHINPSEFSPAALALQKYLPLPTNACGLVTFAIPSAVAENEGIGRVDWTINSKHSLFGRYFVDGYTSPAYYSPTNILITAQSGQYERVQTLTLGETYVISPNIVNAFHATATRRTDRRGPASTGINAATFGSNIDAIVPIGVGLSLTNKWTIYSTAPGTFNVNTFAFSDDANMSLGKHQLAFGGEFVRSQLNINNTFQEWGDYSFSGTYGQKGPSGTSPGGTGVDANLDFLTGALSGFSQSQPQQNALRAPIPSLYFEDTYHATKKVVLSAGVRWEPEFWPVDYFERGSTFSMSNFLNNVTSTVYPNAPAGSLYYGDAGVPKGFTKNSIWQFEPRIGATYDPFGTGKTVLRAGAALVYNEPNFFTGQETQFNPPYATTFKNTPVGAPLSLDNPWSNGTINHNPFPLPQKPTKSATFGNSGQYFVLPAQFHPPYTTQWTASIQQSLGRGWQAQLDYIGNKTTFGPFGFPLNPAVYIPGTCGSAPCSSTGNYAARAALTLANPVQGPKYLVGAAGVTLEDSGVNSSYNGVIATIQHRASSSFVFLANYTWSHCIDIEDDQGDIDTDTVQNPANIKGDRANCGFDYRGVFNTTLVASSHFDLTGWKAQILNNWEIAPLLHVTGGAPFTVTSGQDNSLIDMGADRPNVVNLSKMYTGNRIRSGVSANAQYLCPITQCGEFAQNPIGTFGNSGRNAYRGPKLFQFDSALSRNFPLHERLALDLRLEAFNVLNHPSFSNPSTSISASTFGTITSTSIQARVFQGAVKISF